MYRDSQYLKLSFDVSVLNTFRIIKKWNKLRKYIETELECTANFTMLLGGAIPEAGLGAQSAENVLKEPYLDWK